MQPPAPASSSSPSFPMPSFPESMVGKTLQLLLPYHDATIRGIERSKDDKLTRVKIEALPGVAFAAGELRLESTEGLKFVGALLMDDISGHECTLTVHDDQGHNQPSLFLVLVNYLSWISFLDSKNGFRIGSCQVFVLVSFLDSKNGFRIGSCQAFVLGFVLGIQERLPRWFLEFKTWTRSLLLVQCKPHLIRK
jgi:hypothetical protein